MNKTLRKAIVSRSKIKNRYIQDKNADSYNEYRIQRNIYTTLLRKEKREYYCNLKTSAVSDNKRFWRFVKPIFSENFFFC